MTDKKTEVEILEGEDKILLGHDYDGIRELDHPLPNWWVKTFILTILFAIPYYIAHTFLDAESIDQELTADMEKINKKQKAFADKQGAFSLEEYKLALNDPKIKKRGKKIYKRKCSSCHGKKGGGGIGPNLADKFWINGDGSITQVYDVINIGREDKGMPAWGTKLGKKKTFAVLKYIMEFKGTKPENGKAPQGKEYN